MYPKKGTETDELIGFPLTSSSLALFTTSLFIIAGDVGVLNTWAMALDGVR